MAVVYVSRCAATPTAVMWSIFNVGGPLLSDGMHDWHVDLSVRSCLCCCLTRDTFVVVDYCVFVSDI